MMKSLQGNRKLQTQLPLQTKNFLFGFLLWQSKKPILLHQQHLCNNNTKTLCPPAAASPQFFFFSFKFMRLLENQNSSRKSLKFLLSFKSSKMLENQENQNYTIVEDFMVCCSAGSKESLLKPWILQKPYGNLLCCCCWFIS